MEVYLRESPECNDPDDWKVPINRELVPVIRDEHGNYINSDGRGICSSTNSNYIRVHFIKLNKRRITA